MSIYEFKILVFEQGFHPPFSPAKPAQKQAENGLFLGRKFTGKELDEETGYGYFGARYMDHELMMGWLSVDPMSDKYPNISPYAYCAWNPVKLVDPDGREIWIIGDDGNKYQYKNGKLYNQDGSKYKGNDDYSTKVAIDLRKNLGGVKKEIKEMIKSDKVITITNNKDYSDDGKNSICMLDEDAATNGSGSGSIIYYNREIKSTSDGERYNFIGLAHELGHALDGMKGIIDDTLVDSDEYAKIIPKSEINAVKFENKARSYWDIELRTSYSKHSIKKALGIN